MAKRFTLIEAGRLLPQVEGSIRKAVACKQQYQEAEQTLASLLNRVQLSGGMVVDRQAVLEHRRRRDESAEVLRAAVESIHEFGCLVKDLDLGLVDFPTWYRGREVYLCWKMGETGIQFWHGVDEGFAGRKPIDRDFLDNHKGEEPN
ncbi:MAG: DUF2203 domain-containing protein [Candidatus Solibacter usitatus]|nr:DUF2203 domain-containing protein [Candidatus Solibacter usitatus]